MGREEEFGINPEESFKLEFDETEETSPAEPNELPPGVRIVSERELIEEEKKFKELARRRGEDGDLIIRDVMKVNRESEDKNVEKVLESREAGGIYGSGKKRRKRKKVGELKRRSHISDKKSEKGGQSIRYV